jgi:hypothetical protein
LKLQVNLARTSHSTQVEVIDLDVFIRYNGSVCGGSECQFTHIDAITAAFNLISIKNLATIRLRSVLNAVNRSYGNFISLLVSSLRDLDFTPQTIDLHLDNKQLPNRRNPTVLRNQQKMRNLQKQINRQRKAPL